MQSEAARVATAKVGALRPFVAPRGMARVGGAGGPTREVFGFGLASSLTDPTVGYPSWNFSLLTTVAFFGLHVNSDGTIAQDSGWTVWNSSQLTGLLSTAHAAATKVVVTIILQDFSAGTPNMCAGLAHAATTISATVAEVKAKGVDGVNVDYEGLNGSCGSATDSSWARHTFTSFVASLRAALPAGSYLSVDTYASSATDPLGFFDIGGLAPSVDSFFVMAYDLEYSNYRRPPVNCSSFCLGPTAPLSGYYYNDYSTTNQYLGVVAPSKVILGVPYYGRKACVPAATPNAYPTSGSAVVADTYLDATGEPTAAGVQAGTYAGHRDANDPTGQERWDTWFNTTMSCTRELYWDDTVSLGLKYDLINADNLRGVGIWNLNYGGGATELWRELRAKFATSWKPLGGDLSSGPDLASWAAGRLDAFGVGTDGAAWHRAFNGVAWAPWESLGGRASSDVGAVSPNSGRVDVFVRGTDNGLWHRWWAGTAWSAWEGLGGKLSSGPDASASGAARLDVFARGTDNAVWHRWWDGTTWHSWESLGGAVTSDVGAVSWGAGRLDIFARGGDNAVWHRAWNGTSWLGWESLGGSLGSAPDASSCASGKLDLFALSADGVLWQRSFNGTAWGAWMPVGGSWTSDPGAVCSPGTTATDLVERGTGGGMWHTTIPA
jgi:spore germination protein YaaH